MFGGVGAIAAARVPPPRFPAAGGEGEQCAPIARPENGGFPVLTAPFNLAQGERFCFTARGARVSAFCFAAACWSPTDRS